jgi:PleD family two-component response regulator
MPDSSAEAAHLLLERVREHLQRTPLGARGLAITFSAGVTSLAPEDGDPLATLNRADGKMRRAKAAGKNRVVSS